MVTLEEKQNSEVAYTDFEKTFDKCEHIIIAYKMRTKGLIGNAGR